MKSKQSKAPQIMQITVRTPDGKDVKLSVNPTDTIDDIKSKVE
jgi:hypothetical protein